MLGLDRKKNSKTIHSKLVNAFIIQLCMISLATLLGVYISAIIVEDVLVREALDGEATYFWENYQSDPEFAEPRTLNMTGYLIENGDTSGIPEVVAALSEGYSRVHIGEDSPIAHVSAMGENRLILLFDEVQVSDLAFYFGIAPLSAVLVVMYVLLWVAYRYSKQAVSPVVKLAKTVENYDFRKNEMETLDLEHIERADTEVLALVGAMDEFSLRLQRFIERERNFSRDVSHELRTPLAVMKTNIELLQQTSASPENQRTLERMSQTAREMQELIETFLLLSREQDAESEPLLLNDLVKQEIDYFEKNFNTNNNTMAIRQNSLLEVDASPQVIKVVLRNLLKNAMSYTHSGVVTAIIESRQLVVEDTGEGVSANDSENIFKAYYRATDSAEGFGIGLSIVKRLCDSNGWEIEFSSRKGVGTAVKIDFPGATIVGSKLSGQDKGG